MTTPTVDSVISDTTQWGLPEYLRAATHLTPLPSILPELDAEGELIVTSGMSAATAFEPAVGVAVDHPVGGSG